MPKLNDRQRRFCDEYLKDLNATQAAIRSGYSVKTAGQIGERLLRNVEVAKYLKERMAHREKRTEITQDRVLQEYARIGFFDPRKLFDETGRPLPIGLLDDDTAAVISGVDVATIGNAEQGVGEILKLKLADKKGALDSIARHLGMFNDKLDLGVTKELADKIARARARKK